MAVRKRSSPRQTCATRPKRPSGPRRGELAVIACRQPARSALGIGGCGADRDILADAHADEETPVLGAPSEEDTVADCNSMSLTLGRHPLSLLRPVLLEQHLVPAATLMTFRNGRLARGCGLVTARQRPGTAKGVMFVTIEDETGNVNVIIWPSIQEKFRQEALGASLLAVYGTWQCEGEVRHLVAQRLDDLSHLLGGLTAVSRNFC